METARKLYCSLLPLSHMPRSPSPYRSSSRRRYRDLDRASVSPSRSPPARRYRSRSPPSPGGRYYSRSPPARRPKRSPSRSLSRSRSPPRYRSRRRSPSPRGRRGRRGRSPRGNLTYWNLHGNLSRCLWIGIDYDRGRRRSWSRSPSRPSRRYSQ